MHRAICGNEHSADTHYQTCLHQALTAPTPSPPALHPGRTALPSADGPVPKKTGPYPCPQYISHPRKFAEPWFWWQQQQVSFHKQTTVHLLKTHHIQTKDQTPPFNRQKEPLQTRGLEDKAARAKQKSTYSTHWRHSQKLQTLRNRVYHMAKHYRI